MRISLTIFILLASFFLGGCATRSEPAPTDLQARFQSVPSSQAILLQKGAHKESCDVCGMHLPTFYKTNHAAKTKTHKIKQYCSLHCVVHDNELNKTDLYDIKAVDVATLKFIPAQSAYYVVGSHKPGTMSHISKYAFAKRADADAFARQYGGNIMNFYDAYTVSMQDFMQK